MKAQRLLILVSLLICVGSAVQMAAAAPTSAAVASAAALQQQPAQPAQPPAAQPAPAQPAPAQPAPNVSVTVTKTEDTTMWYMNPVLIGFGILALILLVVLASRTGESTTTVVR